MEHAARLIVSNNSNIIPDKRQKREKSSCKDNPCRLPKFPAECPCLQAWGESRAIRRRRMASAACSAGIPDAILQVFARAMNPCVVAFGPVHLHHRMFAAFRWRSRQRVTRAGGTLHFSKYLGASAPSSSGGHPASSSASRRSAKNPLASAMGSITHHQTACGQPATLYHIRIAITSPWRMLLFGKHASLKAPGIAHSPSVSTSSPTPTTQTAIRWFSR